MSDDRPDPSTTTPDDGLRRMHVRRAPRYSMFLLTGAAVGVLAGLVTGLSGAALAQTGRGVVVGYLAMGLGLLGALLGGVVAVVLDRGRR